MLRLSNRSFRSITTLLRPLKRDLSSVVQSYPTMFNEMKHVNPMGSHPIIGGIHSDMSGTSCDFRGKKVYDAQTSALATETGIILTPTEMAVGIGLNKRDDFIEKILEGQGRQQFIDINGVPPNIYHVDKTLKRFEEIQPRILEDVEPCEGFIDAMKWVASEINPALTFGTGFNYPSAAKVIQMFYRHGLRDPPMVCGSDVEKGREQPDIIQQAMRRVRIWPPSRTLVIGDTIKDIQAAVNAGCIPIGIVHTSSQIPPNPTPSDFIALAQKFKAVGAKYVFNKWCDFPGLIQHIIQPKKSIHIMNTGSCV